MGVSRLPVLFFMQSDTFFKQPDCLASQIPSDSLPLLPRNHPFRNMLNRYLRNCMKNMNKPLPLWEDLSILA